jgi:cyclopropane fatty-acyl-phospholipid synthase-like methyltransferase
MGTDKDWEKWGATDPYFGVLSCEGYRRKRLDESSRQSFFRSGEEHADRVLQLIAENFHAAPNPLTTLDFGCGVGRLAIAFARRSAKCVGVDVSPSMLAEAAKNAQAAGVTNIEFIHSNGDLAALSARFGLVHSYIVLQHIPWVRGRNIANQLASKVAPGGFLAIQFLTASSAPKLVQAMIRARYAVPPVNWLRNIIRRRPVFEPAMQLHVYDQDAISGDLASLGFDEMARCADHDVGEFTSILLVSRRNQNA